MLKIFKCNVCGNIVILTVEGGGKLVCCGQDMTLLEPNTSEGAGEKHLPDVTVEGNKVLVKVGSVAHPMLPAHYIQFVVLETSKGYKVAKLSPGEAPEAAFVLSEGEEAVAAYEYCNLHGLWKTGAEDFR
ncbi:MAG: desulfoferrodoxin FeS4 iron-binding domain-containing protein [Bacteroidales bacterium]|nr:desulfoferrodoxin FeS4 iron-binding domain-containing protein [Bacteroidales bacterium]